MTPAELHDRAMDLCERADRLRDAGKPYLARSLYLTAMELDREAAERELTQPSRAILHRSAAWLAIQAGDPGEGARLATDGLAGHGIPERVRRELVDVRRAAREAM